jgi:curli biogenesis system outer membrane secretion channel CsgG
MKYYMSHKVSKNSAPVFLILSLLVLMAGSALAQTSKKPRSANADKTLEQPVAEKPGTGSGTTAKVPATPLPPKAKKVMITDFDARGIAKWWGGSWDIGSLFANSVLGPLSRTGGYEVVERDRMMEVFKEQGLSESERFSQAAVTKIGRLLGADYILFGFLTDFSRKKSNMMVYQEVSAQISFTARFVDVATGKVLNTAEVNYASPKKRMVMKNEAELNPNDPEFLQSLFGKAIQESAKMAVSQLTGESAVGSAMPNTGNSLAPRTDGPAPAANMPLQGKVADVTGTIITINRGRRHGVKEGQFFVILKVVKEIKDPDTGKVISQKTEELARLRISKVEDAVAEGTLVSGDIALFSFGTEVVLADGKK